MRLLSIIFLISISLPLCTSALARATFPDSHKMQPMPSYVAPNISGNVNSDLTPTYEDQSSLGTEAPAEEAQQAQPVQDQETSVPQDNDTQPSPSDHSLLYLTIAAVVLFLGFSIFFIARGE